MPFIVVKVVVKELVDYKIISNASRGRSGYLLLNLARFSSLRSSPACRVNSCTV